MVIKPKNEYENFSVVETIDTSIAWTVRAVWLCLFVIFVLTLMDPVKRSRLIAYLKSFVPMQSRSYTSY